MATKLTKAQLLTQIKKLKAVRSSRAVPKSRAPRYKYPSGVTKARSRNDSDESVGSRLGGAAGRYLGGAAQKAFKALTGFGDYKVSSNSIAMGTSPPMFRDGKRTNIVQHREYIADVLGSVAFRNTQYALNPGQQGTFPWLSALAQNYEEYRIHGMVWEFKSTAGSAVSSTNNALGVVIMATEYNSLNPPFATKLEMENYQFCTSAKPSESFLHPVECARGENVLSNLYTRTASVPVGADRRFYDLGNFQIATQGMQVDDINVGELWCTYEVELIKPRVVAAVGGTILADRYSWNTIQANTIVPEGSPFGTVAATSPFLPKTGSTLGTSIVTGNGIQFPNDNVISPGEIVYISYCLACSDAAAVSGWNTPTVGACWEFAVLFNSGSTAQFASISTSIGSVMYNCALRRTSVVASSDADLRVFFPTGSIPSIGTQCTMFIMMLNSDMMATASESKAVERKLIVQDVVPDEDDDEDEEALFEALKARVESKRRIRALPSMPKLVAEPEFVAVSPAPPTRQPSRK